MNILILTGRFGMGHIKAAEAIEEQILTENPNAEVTTIDFIDYMFPAISKSIYKGFNFMVSRCAGIYNAVNKAAGKNSGVIPLYTYITDITAHEEWIAPETDKYFVGDVTTKNALLSKGISADKIAVTGIPVRQCFYQEYAEKNTSRKEILIMGGGLGLIPSSENFLQKLSARRDVKVTVITGKNEKLRRSLEKKFPGVEVIGYTDEVNRYMQRADLIVTKAGGITTFEAIAAKTPLYIIKPFLEQEFGNAKYIEDHNIGRVLWDTAVDEAADILKLIENKGLLDTMRKNMKAITESFDRGLIA